MRRTRPRYSGSISTTSSHTWRPIVTLTLTSGPGYKPTIELSSTGCTSVVTAAVFSIVVVIIITRKRKLRPQSLQNRQKDRIPNFKLLRLNGREDYWRERKRTGKSGRKRREVRIEERTGETRMWANSQRDGRPAEHRWRPPFNAAKAG